MLLGASVLLCALTLCEALSCFCVFVFIFFPPTTTQQNTVCHSFVTYLFMKEQEFQEENE